MKIFKNLLLFVAAGAFALTSCTNGGQKQNAGALGGNIAERAYVAPGEHDEFYCFISGGFSGQFSVI